VDAIDYLLYIDDYRGQPQANLIVAQYDLHKLFGDFPRVDLHLSDLLLGQQLLPRICNGGRCHGCEQEA